MWNTRKFLAARGAGATCNGGPIRCSPHDTLPKSLLVTGFGCGTAPASLLSPEPLTKVGRLVFTAVGRYGVSLVGMLHGVFPRLFMAPVPGCTEMHPSTTDTISIISPRKHQVAEGVGVFRYDHDEAWSANMRLFKHFTDVTQGVRRLGAAAVDLCHVALGIVEAYWEYRLKPWDVAAGVCSQSHVTDTLIHTGWNVQSIVCKLLQAMRLFYYSCLYR